MAAQQWWARSEGSVIGPFTSSELKDLARSGRIGPDTMVSPDVVKWAPARKVRGLIEPSEVPAQGCAAASEVAGHGDQPYESGTAGRHVEHRGGPAVATEASCDQEQPESRRAGRRDGRRAADEGRIPACASGAPRTATIPDVQGARDVRDAPPGRDTLPFASSDYRRDVPGGRRGARETSHAPGETHRSHRALGGAGGDA